MAHFAEIDEDGIVLRVLVVPDEQEHRGQEFLSDDLGLGGTWLQTSYNTRKNEHPNGTPLRKNYAGIGFQYREDIDGFVPPKRFESWVLDEERGVWIPPIPRPQNRDSESVVWDEQSETWTDKSVPQKWNPHTGEWENINQP